MLYELNELRSSIKIARLLWVFKNFALWQDVHTVM